jgi:hypothetical protein
MVEVQVPEHDTRTTSTVLEVSGRIVRCCPLLIFVALARVIVTSVERAGDAKVVYGVQISVVKCVPDPIKCVLAADVVELVTATVPVAATLKNICPGTLPAPP